MSEFKFACLYCGQHIACEESWCGRQITCPSCQKQIRVPQHPQPTRPAPKQSSPVAAKWSPPPRSKVKPKPLTPKPVALKIPGPKSVKASPIEPPPAKPQSVQSKTIGANSAKPVPIEPPPFAAKPIEPGDRGSGQLPAEIAALNDDIARGAAATFMCFGSDEALFMARLKSFAAYAATRSGMFTIVGVRDAAKKDFMIVSMGSEVEHAAFTAAGRSSGILDKLDSELLTEAELKLRRPVSAYSNFARLGCDLISLDGFNRRLSELRSGRCAVVKLGLKPVPATAEPPKEVPQAPPPLRSSAAPVQETQTKQSIPGEAASLTRSPEVSHPPSKEPSSPVKLEAVPSSTIPPPAGPAPVQSTAVETTPVPPERTEHKSSRLIPIEVKPVKLVEPTPRAPEPIKRSPFAAPACPKCGVSLNLHMDAGNCPGCGIELVKKNNEAANDVDSPWGPVLFLIVGIVFLIGTLIYFFAGGWSDMGDSGYSQTTSMGVTITRFSPVKQNFAPYVFVLVAFLWSGVAGWVAYRRYRHATTPGNSRAIEPSAKPRPVFSTVIGSAPFPQKTTTPAPAEARLPGPELQAEAKLPGPQSITSEPAKLVPIEPKWVEPESVQPLPVEPRSVESQAVKPKLACQGPSRSELIDYMPVEPGPTRLETPESSRPSPLPAQCEVQVETPRNQSKSVCFHYRRVKMQRDQVIKDSTLDYNGLPARRIRFSVLAGGQEPEEVFRCPKVLMTDDSALLGIGGVPIFVTDLFFTDVGLLIVPYVNFQDSDGLRGASTTGLVKWKDMPFAHVVAVNAFAKGSVMWSYGVQSSAEQDWSLAARFGKDRIFLPADEIGTILQGEGGIINIPFRGKHYSLFSPELELTKLRAWHSAAALERARRTGAADQPGLVALLEWCQRQAARPASVDEALRSLAAGLPQLHNAKAIRTAEIEVVTGLVNRLSALEGPEGSPAVRAFVEKSVWRKARRQKKIALGGLLLGIVMSTVALGFLPRASTVESCFGLPGVILFFVGLVYFFKWAYTSARVRRGLGEPNATIWNARRRK